MTSDDRSRSLADQAADWVPPWDRPGTPAAASSPAGEGEPADSSAGDEETAAGPGAASDGNDAGPPAAGGLAESADTDAAGGGPAEDAAPHVDDAAGGASLVGEAAADGAAEGGPLVGDAADAGSPPDEAAAGGALADGAAGGGALVGEAADAGSLVGDAADAAASADETGDAGALVQEMAGAATLIDETDDAAGPEAAVAGSGLLGSADEAEAVGRAAIDHGEPGDSDKPVATGESAGLGWSFDQAAPGAVVSGTERPDSGTSAGTEPAGQAGHADVERVVGAEEPAAPDEADTVGLAGADELGGKTAAGAEVAAGPETVGAGPPAAASAGHPQDRQGVDAVGAEAGGLAGSDVPVAMGELSPGTFNGDADRAVGWAPGGEKAGSTGARKVGDAGAGEVEAAGAAGAGTRAIGEDEAAGEVEAGTQAVGRIEAAGEASAGSQAVGQVSGVVEAAGDGSPGPLALAGEAELRGALEAILLVVEEPVSEIMLAQVLEQPTERIGVLLTTLAGEYQAGGRGFELRKAAGGWRLYTRPEYAPYVERFVLDGQQLRLTQAALETLAVVAYKQPVTRSRISAIRGVNCDGVIRTLISRGLVEECGTEPDSGAFLYRTTTLFLEKLGLESVDDLPPLAPFLPDDIDEMTDATS